MEISNVQGMMTQFVTEANQSQAEQDEFQNILETAIAEKDDEGLKEACREFEGYFVKQMYSVMKSTLQETTLTEKSHGREIFEDMLDDEYAKEISTGRGIGIADMLYRQLSKDNA